MSRTRKATPSAVAKPCRCHGGCPWCLNNRQYSTAKRLLAAHAELKEFAKQQRSATTLKPRD